MHLLRHAFGLSLIGVLVTACATAQAPPAPMPWCARASTCWWRTACTSSPVARSACSPTATASTVMASATWSDFGLPGCTSSRSSRRNTAFAAPPIPAPPCHRHATAPPGYQSTVSTVATCAPTPEMLAGVQVLLVDLPDAGARYFTYISTTIEVMRSPAMAGIPVIILDRPNPVGGAVQGNVLDSAARSFVGSLSVPMRHGLTLGELAVLAQRRERGLATDLRVVPVSGWQRSQYLDDTGLPFNPPSPNLRDLESIINYSGHLPVRGYEPVGGAGNRRGLLPGGRTVAQPGGGAGPARAAAGREPHRHHLHSPPAGRREVRRHPPAGHSTPGHGSRDLRPAGHRASAPGGHPGSPPCRVRVDSCPFRPSRG